MKKIKNIFRILVVIFIVTTVYSVEAQPPPPPGGSNNTQGNKINGGGGAPIGSGLFILLGLGAAYGGRKLYKLRSEDIEA